MVAEFVPAVEKEKAEEKAAKEEPAKVAEEEAALEQEEEAAPAVPAGYVPVRALQDERLKRQEAERRLAEAAAAPAKPAEAEKPRQYTDDELDALEEDARSRGDRTTIHAVQNYRIDCRARAIVEEREKVGLRGQLHTTVVQGLMQSFPALGDPSSDLFKAAATEFAGLSGEYVAKGFDIASDPHATELAVSRALRKNPVLGGKMPKPKAAEAADTHVETGEGGGPPKTAEKGAKLTQRELDFVRRSKSDPKEYAKWKDREHRG